MAATPQEAVKPSSKQPGLIAGIVVCVVLSVALSIWAVYWLFRRKKPSIPGKRTLNPLAPWLTSSSPIKISRPHPVEMQEKMTRSASVDEGYMEPVTSYSTNSSPGSARLPAHPIYQNREALIDISCQSEPLPSEVELPQAPPKSALAMRPTRVPVPLALLHRPLPLHRQQASRPHTISISAGNKKLRLDKRTTTQALTSKRSISGKTIVIRNDTQTRPSSASSSYSDEYRQSMYPSTPSDPGQSFSRHMTPMPSRHASFMMPGWRHEELPERPEGL